MERFEGEIKFLQELGCHCSSHNSKLYELFAKYKDSEALKKAILATIDAYTVLNTTTMQLIQQLSTALVGEVIISMAEKQNTGNVINTGSNASGGGNKKKLTVEPLQK